MCKMIIVTNVKWPFRIIQSHLFWGQWKANDGKIILYNNTDLMSKASADRQRKYWKKSQLSITLTENFREYPHKSYIARNNGHRATFSAFVVVVVSAYRYIAITNLPIIAVFGEYLRQFLIDLHEIYRGSSVPQNASLCFFQLLSSSGFRARRRRDFFCHFVPVTV